MESYFYHGLDKLDHDLWQQVTQGKPFASVEWLRYGEAVTGEAGYYLIVCKQGKAIGGASFYLLRQEELPMIHPRIRALLEAYLRKHPLVVARTPVKTIHKGVYLPEDAQERAQVLQAIQRYGKDVIKEQRGSFLIFDYLDRADLDDSTWGKDFIKLADFWDVGTKLDISQYQTYADYLADLRRKKGKHPPQDINRHTRRAEEMGIEVRFEREMQQDERIITLLHELDHKYDDDYAAPYENEVASHYRLNTDAVWMKAYYQGRMVACELLLYDRASGVVAPTLFGREQGVDYVYFYTFYRVIRYCIEEWHAKLIIGNTGLEDFKYRIGFEPDSRNHFVVYLPSLISSFFARLLMRWFG